MNVPSIPKPTYIVIEKKVTIFYMHHERNIIWNESRNLKRRTKGCGTWSLHILLPPYFLFSSKFLHKLNLICIFAIKINGISPTCVFKISVFQSHLTFMTQIIYKKSFNVFETFPMNMKNRLVCIITLLSCKNVF